MTIRPLSRSSMPGSAARVHRNAPVALTSSCSRQSASVVRASGALLATPALLTSTSTGPTRSNSAATAASSVTSHSRAADRDDVVARRGEARGDRGADAARAAGHDDAAGHTRHLAQRAPVDLPRAGPRQLGDEAHVARVLVRRQRRLHVRLQRRRIGRRAVAQDDERARLLQAVLLVADDRALGHVGVRGEALLDLLRRDPDAADLEQVVGAAAVVEEAVGVAREEVAAHDHVARVGLARTSRARCQYMSAAVSPSIHSRPVSPSGSSLPSSSTTRAV